MLRRLLRNRYVLPVAVLVTVGLGGALSVASGAAAQTTSTRGATSVQKPIFTTTTIPSHATYPSPKKAPSPAPITPPVSTSCAKDLKKISFPSPPNSGSPDTSSEHTCRDGRITSYGDSAITYKTPPRSYIQAGQELFEQVCSSCHMANAGGGPNAPSLIGVGSGTVYFWITTGRMPAATPLAVQAPEKPPELSKHQAEEIAAFITSLSPSAPFIPTVHLKSANLAVGASLFALNCAACHTITGAGDELAYGTYAPSLHIANPTQIALAIRTGPGNMPPFTGNLTDNQVRDIVAYVSEKIQHPTDPGGFGLGGIGPVAEGFVALLFGVGGFMLICFWIGDRS